MHGVRRVNSSRAAQAVALDISKAFDRVWSAGLLHKLKSCGISGQIFDLISFFSKLRVVVDGKSSQEYPVNVGVPQGFIVVRTLFLLHINYLLDDTTLYSKCDQLSDLWQLELASELESDLRDTVDLDRKWLVDFSVGKTKLVAFDRSNNTGAIDVKSGGFVLEEKSFFKMLDFLF